jgi:hypothetical protein
MADLLQLDQALEVLERVDRMADAIRAAGLDVAVEVRVDVTVRIAEIHR